MDIGGKIRVGVIGAGWWATTNHLPILAKDPRVEISGICGIGLDHLKKVQKEFNVERVTEDYLELLSYDLDALVVASPHHLHHVHAAAGLDHGLAVLCEKPMTLSASDAWDLVNRGNENGAALLVAYGWNYKRFVREAASLMRSGSVGNIEFVTVRMASPTKSFFSSADVTVPSNFNGEITGPDPMTWQDPSHGGGYIHGQLTHATGLLFWLTGLRARRVTGRSSGPGANVDLYDGALVDFTNGAHGVVSGAATLPDDNKFQLSIEVYGSEGVLLLDVERERAEVRRHDGRDARIDVETGEGDYECVVPVERFVDIAGDRSAVNESPGWVAARSVEFLEALRTSALDERGNTVSVDVNLGAGANEQIGSGFGQ